MTQELIERLNAWTTFDDADSLLTEAANALQSQSARIAEQDALLSWFDRHADHLNNDVSSAHSGRGAGASQWMREDDSEFRAELRETLAKIASLTKDSTSG